MPTINKSIGDYILTLPTDRQEVMEQLRKIIKKNLPKGFSEEMNYGMIGYVVPHTLYPAGYHCKPSDPLPFMNIASQKNFIAVYHMGLYADEKLMKWFTTEYPNHSTAKLDMGKSCIRFKKPDQIPMKLIGELAAKMTPKQWIELYDKSIRK
jgi:hypothetical protein